jgi:hypothetical protein
MVACPVLSRKGVHGAAPVAPTRENSTFKARLHKAYALPWANRPGVSLPRSACVYCQQHPNILRYTLLLQV